MSIRCEHSSHRRQDLMSRYLAPGTLVRRTDLSGNGSEDGVVIHCWHDDDLGVFDCYVAFFGSAVPERRPSEKPYVMRYSSTSLTEIKPAQFETGGYELVMGSDVADRNGMYLELNDGSMEAPPLGEVFYCDIDGSMTATTYGNDLPIYAVEWMIAEAKRRLSPRK